MSDPVFVIVNSGQSVSGAFTLERANRPLVVEVPSLSAAAEVRPQFSATSGGPFWTVQRRDGTGLPYTVHSGTGPAIGVIERVPSPWGRLTLTGSQADVRTFTLYASR
jgi:hypothetical protein